MAYIKLTTSELAKIITKAKKEKISNVKGLNNGIAFNVALDVKLLPKSIPLKIIYSHFNRSGKIVLNVLLNKESKILNKGFGLILKALDKILKNDLLPEGIELQKNIVLVDPKMFIKQSDLNITVKNVIVEANNVSVEFEIEG